MVDPRNFLLNTDYPLDKIIYMISGSASVPNSTLDGTPGIVIAHSLPFKPLPILQWSNTSDFIITNEEADIAFTSTYFDVGGSVGQLYRITSDATNINIYRYNTSGGTKTFYYRIFGFMPSNASADSEVPSTASVGDNFIINTDYNYMKLLHAGILTSASPSYTHGLGYVPRVQVWTEFSDGTIERIIEFQDIDTDPTGSGGQTGGVKLTTTTISSINYTPSVHYRIYVDA